MNNVKNYIRETYDLDKTYVCHMQKYYSEGIVTSGHMHDFAEIIFGIQCDYKIYIDEEEYDFKSGDLMFIYPNQAHKIKSNISNETSHICIRFNPYSVADISRYIIPFILKDKNNKCYFSKEELRGNNITDIILETYKETCGHAYGYEIAEKLYLQQICLFLLRWWEKDGKLKTDLTKGNRLHDVFLYIEQNYHQEISVSQMAKRYFISSSYFSKWFKDVTGKTFKQYVNYVRVNHALQLLLKSDHNITEIAMMTGFATTSYFIKQFKLFHGGCSPNKFRSIHQENNQINV